MCVIICRPKNVPIPTGMIEIACRKNADGFGIAIADRGNLNVIKEFTEKGNDPDKVNRLLQEFINHDILLHLRLRSSGDKSLENCHPFMVMDKKTDGVDLTFSHNGTMAWFNRENNQKLCDSQIFTQKILRDVCTRFWAAGVDPLDSPTVQEILKLAANTSNRFALMNGDGKTLIINKTEGVVYFNPLSEDPDKKLPHRTWWASNEYSFKDYSSQTHTYDYSRNNYTHGGGSSDRPFVPGKAQSGTVWAHETPRDRLARELKEKREKEAAKQSSQTNTASSGSGNTPQSSSSEHSKTLSVHDLFPPNISDARFKVIPPQLRTTKAEIYENARYEAAIIGENIMQVIRSAEGVPASEFIADVTADQDTFCGLCGLDDLFEVTALDEEDIQELISMAPELSVLLIKDLLLQNYQYKLANPTFRTKISNQKHQRMQAFQRDNQKKIDDAINREVHKPGIGHTGGPVLEAKAEAEKLITPAEPSGFANKEEPVLALPAPDKPTVAAEVLKETPASYDNIHVG